MRLNLHDPKARQRVLLAGAALGVLVAFLLHRHNAAATAGTSTATVGATTDPTAADPLAGAPSTSGLPNMLDGGVSGVAPISSDTVANAVTQGLSSIDWGALFAPIVSAFPTAAAVDPAASTSASTSASPTYDQAAISKILQLANEVQNTGNPAATAAILALGQPDPTDPGYAAWKLAQGAVQTRIDQAAAAKSYRPTAPATSSTSTAPVSGVARATPPPAAARAPALAPAAYKPESAGVKVAAVTHPSANVTLTHLSNGTVIEQVKGKTPYVVKRG